MAALPLPAKAILLDSPAASMTEVLQALAERLSESTGIARQKIYDALMDRETQGSTALGFGVAVPHARLPDLASAAVAALRSRRAVEFAAPDAAGVRIFVAVLVPAGEAMEHLEILSHIAARLTQETARQQLAEVQDVDAFRALLVA
ncbi:PTS sugar transporter subunit IIA [Acidithiobacillus sp. AMEEHan]|uniref:PTS sugar transporter subunit IIA n=1 Tax=Acidithiobacillus sp. AMEEHan TaxID=2994951 RepID=UPI0027E54586|nr:PTS sugar transporter subunit IIA [Acidithiobacillus sp. AMEEHan]